MSSLFYKFSELPFDNSHDEFVAIPVSEKREDFIAKSITGAPVFLLNDSGSEKYHPSINFQNFTVDFNVACSINTNSDTLKGNFCIITFNEDLQELHEIFINCVCSALDNLPEVTNTKKLELFILGLGELFRTLNSPEGREITGLWSELFIILISGNPTLALISWHSDPYNVFDFNNSGVDLEVKSTIKLDRIHEFSLEQLSPNCLENGYVASILLKENVCGYGIVELANEIECLIEPCSKLKEKLWANIMKTLGSNFSEKLDKFFDIDYAKQNARIYYMSDIPRINNPNDNRITNIRFKSNINDLPTWNSLTFLKEIFKAG